MKKSRRRRLMRSATVCMEKEFVKGLLFQIRHWISYNGKFFADIHLNLDLRRLLSVVRVKKFYNFSNIFAADVISHSANNFLS